MITISPGHEASARAADAITPREDPRAALARSSRVSGSRVADDRGRRLRVLHVGNIANNAYNNAKLLNEAGFDNDVICYDYYHVMACPEWEDADFPASEVHPFFPRWHRVDLGGFRRPRWFAQGPQRLCIAYLLNRARGRRVRASVLWSALELSRIWLSEPLARSVSEHTRRVISGTRSFASSVNHAMRTFAYETYRLIVRGRAGVRTSGRAWLSHLSRTGSLDGLKRLVRRLGRHRYTGHVRNEAPASSRRPRRFGRAVRVRNPLFEERTRLLTAAWQRAFPHRVDALGVDQLVMYEPVFDDWRKLFEEYDVVLAYSTDPILPLLTGSPYFAFEHGTLRSIPGENSTRGRCTSLAYACAEHVFVTNADCLANAEALNRGNVTLINHPFDEDHGSDLAGVDELRERLLEKLDATFLVFFPTRQDWVPGTGFADKANDVFLDAFAALRDRGLRIGMVCCEWGSNVAESRQRLEQRGVDRHVSWAPPMGVVEFERHAAAADLVADQFALGAFGGVMFKAMAVGTIVCTFLDEKQVKHQYAEVPPVLNCRTPGEIERSISALAGESRRISSLGEASRAWIRQYHGKHETIARQVAAFSRLMPDTLSLGSGHESNGEVHNAT